jgi:hypothetical protein
MSPQAGSRLGPYELTGPIGAGGMGEVWRGRDTRLDRSVAVKILPAGFAQDAERRIRFEREARTISALNHPHICTLFDVGHEGDSHYLVMELLEGESLADRLLRGPLPLDQVVKFGAQVADALDAAHKQGIVHRDLKPGNVMLTKTGAKLLDFGLARSGAGVGLSTSTELPTEEKPLTTAGTVVGTFQYMAPEQLEGQEANPRTARQAFEGRSKTSLIAAILTSQPPPVSSVTQTMPPALDHVVRKCLEKDPDDRWQSAHDVANELRWIGEAGSQAGVPATLSLRRRSRERLAWTLVAVLATASVVGIAWALNLRRVAREAERPFRTELVPPPDIDVATVASGAVALSPDGHRLAFVAAGQRTSLAVRDFASAEMTRLVIGQTQEAETGWDVAYVALADTAKAVRFTASPFQEVAPALSPNGRWLAYASNETGRSEIFVSNFPEGARKWQVSSSGGFRPTWRTDGRELYFTGPDGAMVVSVTDRPGALEIGAPERLPFPRDALNLALGIHSTDGKRFLVLRYEAETFTEPIRLIRGWRRLVER